MLAQVISLTLQGFFFGYNLVVVAQGCVDHLEPIMIAWQLTIVIFIITAFATVVVLLKSLSGGQRLAVRIS